MKYKSLFFYLFLYFFYLVNLKNDRELLDTKNSFTLQNILNCIVLYFYVIKLIKYLHLKQKKNFDTDFIGIYG